MSNVSFHDVMSRHVVMSCHVIMFETDPCVCPCQYSPTHVKDQNPCLCVKCPFQRSHPHSFSVGLVKVCLENPPKRPNSDQIKCHAPFSAHKHVGSDRLNMSFYDVMSRYVTPCRHVMSRTSISGAKMPGLSLSAHSTPTLYFLYRLDMT